VRPWLYASGSAVLRFISACARHRHRKMLMSVSSCRPIRCGCTSPASGTLWRRPCASRYSFFSLQLEAPPPAAVPSSSRADEPNLDGLSFCFGARISLAKKSRGTTNQRWSSSKSCCKQAIMIVQCSCFLARAI